MARPCSVCRHPDRDAINAALVDGTPNRRVATQHGVSEAAVRRHRADHLPAALIGAHDAEEVAHADSLLDQLAVLQADARRIQGKAEASRDYRAALAGIRELVRICELIAKLIGELDERPRVNVLVASPEWTAVRTTILRALEPHPEARLAVARALRELRAGDDRAA